MSEIKTVIEEAVNNKWQQDKAPLLLSALGVMLKNENLLDDKPKEKLLHQWIGELNIEGISLVQDPNVKARIGFVPKNSDFSWPTNQKMCVQNNGITLQAFTHLLRQKLTDDEISQIPTHILLKIFDY